MNKDKWASFVDLMSFLWLSVFSVGLFHNDNNTSLLCNYINVALLPVFIVDLIFTYRRSESLQIFLKRRWPDVLMVIPYFRIFRVFRWLKFVRHLRFVNLLKSSKIPKSLKFIKKTIKAVETAESKKMKILRESEG